MNKHLTKQEWIHNTEETTRNKTPENIKEAQRVFKEELTPQEQMKLAEEIVETRAVELCRAYKNVIDVSYGYGRKQNKNSGKMLIKRKPCVTFVVKKKWKLKYEEVSDEKLPKNLFAYWIVKNKRKLCAVSTDVECASEYSLIRPQTLPQKIAVKHKSQIATGSITCAVQRSTFGKKLFAMSCRHVFSLSLMSNSKNINKADVHVGKSSNPNIVGQTLSVKGELRDGLSFDAQLAMVEDVQALKETLKGLKFSGYAESLNDIPEEYFIVTPRKKIKAKRLRFVADRIISYGRRGIRRVKHQILVESEITDTEPTIKGDSGSPVVSNKNGGMLLGMHIAGTDSRRLRIKGSPILTFMIPAWQLFNPSKYRTNPNIEKEKWKLVNP